MNGLRANILSTNVASSVAMLVRQFFDCLARHTHTLVYPLSLCLCLSVSMSVLSIFQSFIHTQAHACAHCIRPIQRRKAVQSLATPPIPTPSPTRLQHASIALGGIRISKASYTKKNARL